jgi:hypothetical protein
VKVEVRESGSGEASVEEDVEEDVEVCGDVFGEVGSGCWREASGSGWLVV